MQLQVAGTQPGFRFWAMVSSAALGVMCVVVGVCVMHMQSLVELYDYDLKSGMKWGLRFGLPGLAVSWCGYIVLLAIAASARVGGFGSAS